MNHISVRTRLWVALIAAVLLGGTFFAAQPSSAITKPQLQRAMLSTVKLLIVDADLNLVGTCSGTHLGEGVIVTAFHCVGHTDLYGPDDTGMDLQNGDLYHPEGWIGVAPQKDPKEAPKPTYFAQYLAGTPDHDLAVVRIFRMIDPKAKLPADIPIPAMTITDSDSVDVNDPVYVIGYPGVGGDLITVSNGIVSGFDDEDGDGTPDTIKTNAPINPGNSGGLAVNDNGDQVGIPAWGRPGGTGIGGILMINMAVPYIEQVLDLQNVTPGPTVASSSPTPGTGPTTTPVPGSGPFGPVTFGTDVANGELTGTGTAFETNTKQIIGVFSYQGMRNGQKWGWAWQYNGQTVIDSRNSQTWDGGAKGTTGVQLSNKKGLPDGSYNLLLFVNNNQVQQASFTIGDVDATPAPATPAGTPEAGGVILQGQIIDADTEEGISGAVMVVLRPGTTVDEWDNSEGDDLAAAIGVADEEGYYLTSPGLERNQTYTVILGAKGYERRVFEDGLELTDDDPDVLDIEPLMLQTR